jgi:hypothetical protein
MVFLAYIMVSQGKTVVFCTKNNRNYIQSLYELHGEYNSNFIITTSQISDKTADLIILDDVLFDSEDEQASILTNYETMLNDTPVILVVSTQDDNLKTGIDFVYHFRKQSLKIWNRCVRLYRVEKYAWLFSEYMKLTVVRTKNGDLNKVTIFKIKENKYIEKSR